MNEIQLSDSEKEGAKFLDRDFTQCFTQMRHYDSQMLDVCKFAFGAYTTTVGAALALFKYGLDKGIDYGPASRAMLTVALLLGLVMVSYVVRNRVYFVVLARYINEHRGFFLSRKPLEFLNQTRMYTNSHQPPYFNGWSSQSLLLYILCILNAGVLGVLVYLIFPNDLGTGRIAWAVTLFLFAQIAWSVTYLVTRERKPVGEAVFGKF